MAFESKDLKGQIQNATILAVWLVALYHIFDVKVVNILHTESQVYKCQHLIRTADMIFDSTVKVKTREICIYKTNFCSGPASPMHIFDV